MIIIALFQIREIHGLKRRSSSFNTARIDQIYQDPHEEDIRLKLHFGDMTDSTNLIRIVQEVQPDEIYNLAAQSHVQVSGWHYCLRLPGDVLVHGVRRHPIEVKYLWPAKGEAILYDQVGLWTDGIYRCNLVLARVTGVKEPWAVITDETPSLNTLWQYALRFRVEELFLDSKSGAFQLEDSAIRSAPALTRLYLVPALALLYATTHGMAVQLNGLRSQVDPHWTRGLSYLKIGLRWLQGVVHKGRSLLSPIPLFHSDPEPCFSSKNALSDYYDRI